jgi:hypothetical protein
MTSFSDISGMSAASTKAFSKRGMFSPVRALMLRMLMLAGEDEGEEARLFLSADWAE